MRKMTDQRHNRNREPEAWNRAKRMAFWDQGKFTYAQWRAAVNKGDLAVIRQSVNYMRAADFIDLSGEESFIKSWPAWRAAGSSLLSVTKVQILNAAWGYRVAGDVSFPVDVRVTRFHSKKRSTLRTLVRSDGTDSIYRLAKKTGRNYRRVYDDVQDFVKIGIVKLNEEIRSGRTVSVAKVPGVHCPLEMPS